MIIDQINRAMPLLPWLDLHNACDKTVEAVQEAGWTTLGEAWDRCTNMGWLLWGLAREGYSDEAALRLFACRCVRETPLVSGGVVGDLLTDPRSWTAIKMAERFAQGQASAKELAAVHETVWAAARDATEAMTRTADDTEARKRAWAVAWAAQAAAWATTRKVWDAAHTTTGAAAQAATLAIEGATQEAATQFHANLLRQMIDPFQSDRS